ncbi:MAG TPA: hypothetical protein VKE41_01785 [Roseiflexaceae bacterium]|nr:hypothetical protein [Roseiflexaceae bacterium]
MITLLSTRRLASVVLIAQALGGALFGLALGAATGLIGAQLFAGTSDGWGDLIAAIVGAIIGYTIGVSLGVYLIGRRLGGRGAYWRTLIGSIVGTALVLLAAEPLHLNANATVLQVCLIALPPIGATFGFNVSRKARR